jgi:folylpolyglutamate synthase
MSVISKIAQDHENVLGNTLAEIALHKAGILRPNVPYLINLANEVGVITIIKDYATEIGAGLYLSTRSFNLENKLYGSSQWNRIRRAMASFEEDNVKMAVVAVMQTLASMEQAMEPLDIAKSLLANVKVHHGRLEKLPVPPIFRNPAEGKNGILVDGAHNLDAAIALVTSSETT